MKTYKIYKHKNCTDVAFQIITCTEKENSNILKIQGYWWNIVNFDNIHLISSDEIEIKKEDINNWQIYE